MPLMIEPVMVAQTAHLKALLTQIDDEELVEQEKIQAEKKTPSSPKNLMAKIRNGQNHPGHIDVGINFYLGRAILVICFIIPILISWVMAGIAYDTFVTKKID